MTCALYRHFDTDGTLLYVGVSANPFVRLKEHLLRSDWIDQVTRIEIEHHVNRATALAAEKVAIQSEKPVHNHHHNAECRGFMLEPARTVIQICGGVDVVAKALGLTSVSVRRWGYEKGKPGGGGLVPSENQQALLTHFYKDGLRPDHFFLAPSRGNAA